MSCFSCMSPRPKNVKDYDEDMVPRSTNSLGNGRKDESSKGKGSGESNNQNNNVARSFAFKELVMATENFREVNLIGEGGFARVYRGRLDSGMAFKGTNVDVLMLSLMHHHNLINLIGYCTHGEQRLLVTNLESGKEPLSWKTRLKIAAGSAHGLEYLHRANPPVIYRDLKCSNILLDNEFNPKLSDFGLAKLGPVGDRTHVSTRVMGTYGYCAPECAMTGKLTLKSDIYSLGVVLLELITGRKAYDISRKPGEQNLVQSSPFLKGRRKYIHMVDPALDGQFSARCLHHAVAVTAMCLQEQANFRPSITDIVTALDYLVAQVQQFGTHRGGSHSSNQQTPSSSEEFNGSLRKRSFGNMTVTF
ncbi:unnamed protein product [Withania somnifera]